MTASDSKEAFRVNACKKVVRLSKLIEQFTVESQDRYDQINKIHSDFQRACQAIVDRFNRESAKISRDLHNFRKEYISETCSQFSEEYKTIKREFTKYKNGQIRKLNSIIVQSKNLQQTVQLIQNTALKNVSDTLNSASEMEENLHNCTSPEYMENFIKPHIQPILDKIDRYQRYSEDRIRRMRNRYEGRSDTLRTDYNTEIKAIYRKYAPAFESMKYQIKDLKTNIFDTKMQVTRYIDSNKVKMKYHILNKNSFIRDTQYLVKEIDDKISLARERQRTMMNTYNNEIQTLNNQYQTKLRNRNFKLEFLDKMISEKTKQYDNFVSNWDEEMSQKVIQIGNDTTQYNKRGFHLRKQKKEELAALMAQIKECENNSNELIEKLKEQIDRSTSFSQNYSIQFSKNLRQQETKVRNILKSSKDMYIIQRRGRLFILQKAGNLQINSDINIKKDSKESVDNLKKELQTLKINNDKQIKALKKESNTKLTDNLKQLTENLKSYFNQKNKEFNSDSDKMKKEANRIKTEFSNEVQSKVNHYNNMVNIKVRQYKLTLDQSDPKDPTDKTVKQNLQSQLDKIDSEMKEIQKKHRILLDGFEKQIQTIEKLKRKILRNINTETTSINSEYELKIQVAQVTLKEKLENLSKIYDPDENQRGCDIIEAFRHIQDVRHETSDEAIQLRRACENMKEEQKKKKNQLREKIKWFSTIKPELMKRYEIARKRADTEIPELEKVLAQEILPLQSLITELNAKFNSEMKVINEESSIQTSNFEKEVSKIEEEKKIIKQKMTEQLSQIDNNHSKVLSKIRKDHSETVFILKSKIEEAKKKKDALMIEYKQKRNAEFVSFCSQLKNNISLTQKNIRCSFESENTRLDSLVNEKIKRMLQFDLAFACNLTPRRGDKKEIECKRSSLSDLDKRTAGEFNTHSSYLKQPSLIRQRQMRQQQQLQIRMNVQSHHSARNKNVKIILDPTNQNTADNLSSQFI